MTKETKNEDSKEVIAAKHRLLNRKNVIVGLSFVILIFSIAIFIIILKFEDVDRGAVILKPKNIENSAKTVWNDVFYSVNTTLDGGYIAVGCSTDRDLVNTMCTDVYEEDAIITKYNEKGDITWEKYLNALYNDEYNSVQQTSDGGYIAVGYIVGGGNHLKGDSEWYDAIIAKYSASGKLIWDKKYGNNWMNEEFSDVRQTSDGGYIVVGGKRKGYDEYDALIVKYNASGQMTWTKSFGGKGYDYFNSVQQTSDDGYIALGSACSGSKGSNGGNDDNHALIVKYNKYGKIIWKNKFEANGDGYYSNGKQTIDGGYIAVGFCFSLGGYSSLIVKYNETGTVLWHNELLGASSFSSVEETEDGEYMVVGDSYSTDGGQEGLKEEEIHSIIVKFDKTGNMVEKNILKDALESTFSCIERTSDGKYIVIGDVCNIDEGFNGKNDTKVINKYNSDMQASEQLVLQKIIDYHRMD